MCLSTIYMWVGGGGGWLACWVFVSISIYIICIYVGGWVGGWVDEYQRSVHATPFPLLFNSPNHQLTFPPPSIHPSVPFACSSSCTRTRTGRRSSRSRTCPSSPPCSSTAPTVRAAVNAVAPLFLYRTVVVLVLYAVTRWPFFFHVAQSCSDSVRVRAYISLSLSLSLSLSSTHTYRPDDTRLNQQLPALTDSQASARGGPPPSPTTTPRTSSRTSAASSRARCVGGWMHACMHSCM